MTPTKFIKSIFSDNNIIPIVSLTTVGVICMVIFIFINYSYHLHELEQVLNKGEIESKKMQLNSELMELARSRTRLTSEIIATKDPFKQDELNQEMEVYANRFSYLRQQLLNLPLSKLESSILNEHRKIITIILPAQREAVAIAIQQSYSERRKAERMLYDIVLPGQKKLISSFQKLIEYEQNIISKISQENLALLRKTQQRNILIIAIILTFIISLSIVIIKRIYHIQKSLHTTNTQLANTNIELEKRVAERTSELSELNQKLKDASEHDELTNIYNRRKFNDYIENEYVRTNRLDSEFSLIMIDIDFFKQFNDLYGHQKGDDCLVAVAAAMSASLPRSTDFIARYGGEEFVVILPSTGIEGARIVAEHLKKAVLDLKIPHDDSAVNDYVSISLGLTVYRAKDNMNTADIIKNADQCLYAAKAKGRNQVVTMS